MSVLHTAAGVVFLLLGGAYLLDDLGVLTVSLRVLGPLALIVAGLALVLPRRPRLHGWRRLS